MRHLPSVILGRFTGKGIPIINLRRSDHTLGMPKIEVFGWTGIFLCWQMNAHRKDKACIGNGSIAEKSTCSVRNISVNSVTFLSLTQRINFTLYLWTQSPPYLYKTYSSDCVKTYTSVFFTAVCNRPDTQSNNAPVPYPTMHNSEQKCAHFCSEWCTVGHEVAVLWDLWIWSIVYKNV